MSAEPLKSYADILLLHRFSSFIRRSTTVRITACKPVMQSTFRLRSQFTQAVPCMLSQKQSAAKKPESHPINVSLCQEDSPNCSDLRQRRSSGVITCI